VPPISRPRLIGAPGEMVIGVCTYNRGPEITRTLAALAALDPIRTSGAPRLSRIVIVNNRSTDDTPAVVDRFIAGNRGDGGPRPPPRARIYHRSPGDHLLGDSRLRLDAPASFLMGASTAYRRQAVLDSGWLDGGILECRRGEQIDCGEDAELCLRIRRAGWEI